MVKHNKIITILLVISLILNIYTLFKINATRDIIADDFNFYLETVFKDLDEIKDMIIQTKKERQWISKIDIERSENAYGNPKVKFVWMIKEFIPDSKVVLYTRKSGDENFQQLPVSSLTEGRFSSELEIKVEDGPEWDLSYEYDNKDYRGLDNIYPPLENSPYVYEYYVASYDGTRLQTSEMENANLYKFLKAKSTIDIEITINSEKEPSIIDFSFDRENNMPNEIIIEIYDGNEINEEIVKVDKLKGFGVWESDGKIFNKLVIRAEYGKEKIFKKEIWDKNKVN